MPTRVVGAMARALHLLGIDVDATRALVDNSVGAATPIGNPSVLADAIERYCALRAEDHRVMGEAGARRAAETFCWNHVARNQLELFERA